MSTEIDLNGIIKLKKNLKELEGTSEVRLDELITSAFLSECSEFSNLEHMIAVSGFSVTEQEDFEAIPDDEWDNFISNNTTFESWAEMRKVALDKYLKEKIFKGIK